MEIQIDPHTQQRLKKRGTTEQEIIETLRHGFDIPGKYGRLGKVKVFTFNSIYNEKYYQEKKLEVYYIIELEKIITVTVYVFFGKF